VPLSKCLTADSLNPDGHRTDCFGMNAATDKPPDRLEE